MRARAHTRSLPPLQLSKQYHPDAPSTSSSSVSPEDRLAHFQSISASYATLSDDSLRRSYDANLGASAHGRRPRYARGHSGFSSSGVGGAADSRPWSDGENERRRERANYAWAHPSSSTRRSAGADARNRSDPFAGTSNGGRGAAGVGGHSESLFRAFAAREAFARDRAAGGMGAGASASATSAFGDKAEEESRLINDSSTKRTGQVSCEQCELWSRFDDDDYPGLLNVLWRVRVGQYAQWKQRQSGS